MDLYYETSESDKSKSDDKEKYLCPVCNREEIEEGKRTGKLREANKQN